VVDHIVALAFEYFGDPSPFGSGAEVRLTPAELVDGPWLPDGANVNRYDADLRRVRRVVIRVRAQAASAALRGPAGLLFTHGGTARDARRRVPDVDASFDVSPPNLRPLS
jgi:hypothetical protein